MPSIRLKAEGRRSLTGAQTESFGVELSRQCHAGERFVSQLGVARTFGSEHKNQKLTRIVTALLGGFMILLLWLSVAKIKSAFAMNNMQIRRVTFYMEDNEASRSFGE